MPVSLAEKHSKAKTGKLSQNSALQNSGALCLCREKRSVFGKPRLQRRQKQSCQPSKASGDILGRLPKKDCFRHTKIFLIQNSNFPLCENPVSSLPKNVANYPKTRRKPIFFALTKGGCTKKRRPIPDAFFTGFPLIAGVTRAFK